MQKLTIPNALSVSRLLLAPLCFIAVIQADWIVAASLLLLAVFTDMTDGWLARRRDQASALGGLLDHGSDAVFVTTVLSALAVVDIIPTALPPLVILAFTQYMLDSKALRGRPLRASRIGRYNGIAYFVLAGFPLVQSAIGLDLVGERVFAAFGWLLVATTVISMADRAVALLRQQ